jgi:hypothetical protein
MPWDKHAKSVGFLAALLVGMGFACSAWAQGSAAQSKRAAAQAPPPAYIPSATAPDDVQLVNADANATIRIPVSHSSLNWTLIKPRIKASYGWLEISRITVRYSMLRPSRVTKEPDQEFEFSRTELLDLKMEYNAAAFRARGLRHWFGYSPQNHWDAADSQNAAGSGVNQADAAYTPFILRALLDFDGVVAELKRKQQAPAPPPVVVQPTATPAPEPASPPSPPTLVVMAPSGVNQNQTVEVNESPLIIRGIAMDNSGLPTITINGAPAALRPKTENAAEYWSDPITLKPGDNAFDIVATSPAKVDAHFQFVAHFTPKAAPANPHALGKDEIISLLRGQVPVPRVVELVRDRGVKFTPTPADLDDLRAAGGNEDLIQAVQQAAAARK